MHRKLKLNSKNSVGKYKKKLNSLGPVDFLPRTKKKFPEYLPRSFLLLIMFKKQRFNNVVSLAKSQSAKRAHITI